MPPNLIGKNPTRPRGRTTGGRRSEWPVS